jgi:hypothetical protein
VFDADDNLANLAAGKKSAGELVQARLQRAGNPLFAIST